jgi:hypothetical protein
MRVINWSENFTPSKTYKTQANLQKAIAPLLSEIDGWDNVQKANMGQMNEYATLSYSVSVTPEGRFFPIFVTEGFNMTLAHLIIEKGFCVKVS